MHRIAGWFGKEQLDSVTVLGNMLDRSRVPRPEHSLTAPMLAMASSLSVARNCGMSRW